MGNFGDCVAALGSLEINKSLQVALSSFADTQKNVKTVVQEQATSDLEYLANLVDEYVRAMNSVKVKPHE